MMTLKEKLAREHPECINSKNPGGCDGCPKEYGYSDVCLRTHKGCADIYKDICAACWDQEYIEAESKSEKTDWKKAYHDLLRDYARLHEAWEHGRSVIKNYETTIESLKELVKKYSSDESTMTANKYQLLALRTEPTYTKSLGSTIRLEQGLMGLNGEAGEAIDILKKFLFQNHELNKEHLAKELGDVAWYLALSADALGYNLEDIFKMNIEKLKARYPDGFETEKSKNRAENDI